MPTVIPQSLRGILRPDGRCLVIAMDHALSHGPARGLDDPAALIERMIASGADAIMTSYGVVKKYGHLIRPHVPIIMRIDGGPSVRTGTWREYTDYRLLYQVADAAQLGADAVVVMHFVGAPAEMATLSNLAAAATQCASAGLPLLVEALPCPHPNIPQIFDSAAIALAARIAAEHGADFVKTTYSGDVESFRSVVQAATVPLLVLGGERINSDRAVLELTHDATAAGAAGMAIGRNIWQAPKPAGMVRALAAILHEGATVDAAEGLLRDAG
jgi:fructose-bisphosphate aldolase, class I